MRLIDADALTDFLKCLFPDRGMWEIEGDTAKDAICETVVEAMEMVKNMETIQPRPKGRWVKISPAGIYECSKCGKYVMTDDISEYDFCHGCGADMREETHERL